MSSGWIGAVYPESLPGVKPARGGPESVGVPADFGLPDGRPGRRGQGGGHAAKYESATWPPATTGRKRACAEKVARGQLEVGRVPPGRSCGPVGAGPRVGGRGRGGPTAAGIPAQD